MLTEGLRVEGLADRAVELAQHVGVSLTVAQEDQVRGLSVLQIGSLRLLDGDTLGIVSLASNFNFAEADTPVLK